LILSFRLTHTERDIASKRLLIENYKARLNEMETNLSRSNEKTTTEVKQIFSFKSIEVYFFFFNQNDDERVKSLTETMEKLRVSVRTSTILNHLTFCFCYDRLIHIKIVYK
jgi:hypothetical protein